MWLLDFIFPKRCVSCKRVGNYICADCFVRISFASAPFCLVCNKASVDGLTHPGCRAKYLIDGCFSSLSYTGVTRKLMYTYKFQPYLSDLSGVLGELFYEGLIQSETFYKVFSENSIFVPIPLHRARQRKRGYDQVVLLSNYLSKKLGARTVQLLERVKKTHSQYGLLREARIENVKGAFGIRPAAHLQDISVAIFLVDDVVTSGATFMSAARALKKAGYKSVYGIALAHGGIVLVDTS